VAHRLAQVLDILMKTQRHAIRGAQIHVRLVRNESRNFLIAQLAFYDTVRLEGAARPQRLVA
jgi:hypothetical protein